jgi:hypothetical protein
LPEQHRKLAVDFIGGITTSEAAQKYGLSPGRISQYRRELVDLYKRFAPD